MPRRTVQQENTQLLFQGLNLEGSSWLADTQILGCHREAAKVYDAAESLQLSKVHGSHLEASECLHRAPSPE
jgi:hypothetical protein